MATETAVRKLIKDGALLRQCFVNAGSTKTAFNKLKQEVGGQRLAAYMMPNLIRAASIPSDHFRFGQPSPSRDAHDVMLQLHRAIGTDFLAAVAKHTGPGIRHNMVLFVIYSTIPSLSGGGRFHISKIPLIASAVDTYGWQSVISLYNENGVSYEAMGRAIEAGVDPSLLASMSL
jgi:hypothetical protein